MKHVLKAVEALNNLRLNKVQKIWPRLGLHFKSLSLLAGRQIWTGSPIGIYQRTAN